MQHSQGFLTLVQQAKTQIQETDIDTVKQKLDDQEDFYLVDVREDNEWQRGHLPQALHMGKGIIERDIEQRIPDQQAKIVLYCGGGFRSALAAEALQKMGYTQAISMDGGFSQWVASGYPVVAD